MRFNPDGTPAGTAVVRREIELGLKARHLVSTVTFQFLDTNDNVIASGCGTERSVRKQ